jgi:hypothetical protein
VGVDARRAARQGGQMRVPSRLVEVEQLVEQPVDDPASGRRQAAGRKC